MRSAEAIELVDMSPSALRRRLAHGERLPGRARRRGAVAVLPRGQPRRAAGAGPALARRAGSTRAWSATGRGTRSRPRGRRASGSSWASRAVRSRSR
ncbi:MAG: hypothetical protein PGN15_07110 [Aeromicrobium erythreum]